MKKFIVILCILLALGGTAFFFGWAQLAVPPDAYGVVRSKTHGIDGQLVRSGEFRWLWYKLIPTNVEITVFRLNPVRRAVNVRNTLPSAAVYAAFAGTPGHAASPFQGADFSWELGGVLSFSLAPDRLVSVVQEYGLADQEALDAWQQELAGRIEARILSRLNSADDAAAADTDAAGIEELLKTGRSAALENEIRAAFPQIADFSLTISEARFPDFALYRQVKTMYEDYLARQREYLLPTLNQQAQERINSRLRFDELERYGELLVKYPVLLEYLALEKGVWNSQNQK